MSMTPPGSEPGSHPGDTGPPVPSPPASTPVVPPPPGAVPGAFAPPAPVAPIGHQPPPGYVAYRQGAASPIVTLQSTAGLRKATLILFSITVALYATLTVALFWRVGVWDDFVAGTGSFASLDDADSTVGVLAITSLLTTLAGGIVLSIWSLRLVRNAEQFGGTGLRPGRACGGWYIPLGNMWFPFVQLKATMSTLRGSDRSISRWQGGWIAMVVLGFIENSNFELDSIDPDVIRSTLNNQAAFSVLTLAITAAAAWFARRAMNELDAGLARRHEEHIATTTGPPLA